MHIELSNIITALGREIRELAYWKESSNLIYPSINELKQTIEQVSTAPNPLLYAPSSASADKVTKENSNNQDIDNIIEMIDKLPNYEKYKKKVRSDMTQLKEKFDVDFKNTSATYWIEKGQLNIDEETSLLNIHYQRLLMFVDGYRIEREYKREVKSQF